MSVHPASISYAGPAFGDARVRDAMHLGIITCHPDTPLRDVARIMAGYRVHCVIVLDSSLPGRPWGVISDLDLAEAAGDGLLEHTAGEIAGTEMVAVAADETVERAAQLMAEHDVTHLVALQPETGDPIGVISALGLASVLAYGRS